MWQGVSALAGQRIVCLTPYFQRVSVVIGSFVASFIHDTCVSYYVGPNAALYRVVVVVVVAI